MLAGDDEVGPPAVSYASVLMPAFSIYFDRWGHFDSVSQRHGLVAEAIQQID